MKLYIRPRASTWDFTEVLSNICRSTFKIKSSRLFHQHSIFLHNYNLASKVVGPVVRRSITANPGLNFNLGFFFFS